MIEAFDAALPHGITLSCRAAGARGAPRVMLLHGFPEAAFVWDEVMSMLAPQARCVAPNQRGYERSSAPAEVAAYRPRHLVSDLEALIADGGGPVDVLVGHDWGGALAWNLAAQRPQLVRQLVIVNAPHPATFLRELRHNPAQQAASAYMNVLCQPDAEALLAQNDYERLWPLFTRMGEASWLDGDRRAKYREVWRHGLTGALNWYRASPLRPPASAADPILGLQLDDEAVTVRVPTTVVWGDGDTALLPGLLDGLERWVPQLRLCRVSGASHWIVHEQPERVAAEVARALRAASAPG
jgi:pimeloyl-ACP methyl ester carboxylesterase